MEASSSVRTHCQLLTDADSTVIRGGPFGASTGGDCAYGGVVDSTAAVVDEASVEASYLLAFAPPNKHSLSLPGEFYTAFTGALLALLNEGVLDGPPLLHRSPMAQRRSLQESLHDYRAEIADKVVMRPGERCRGLRSKPSFRSGMTCTTGLD